MVWGGVEVVGEGALIAGWFEMPRWAGLPGDRRLLGLFHEASQAHLCGAQEFGVAALHERRQEDVKRPVMSGRHENSLQDGIGSGQCGEGGRLIVIVFTQ